MENNAVGQPYNPAVIKKKKNLMTIFTMGFSFLNPGAYVDLGPVGEWAEQNGGGINKHRQNSKTSPFVFIFFLFAFRTTDEQQFGFA